MSFLKSKFNFTQLKQPNLKAEKVKQRCDEVREHQKKRYTKSAQKGKENKFIPRAFIIKNQTKKL